MARAPNPYTAYSQAKAYADKVRRAHGRAVALSEKADAAAWKASEAVKKAEAAAANAIKAADKAKELAEQLDDAQAAELEALTALQAKLGDIADGDNDE